MAALFPFVDEEDMLKRVNASRYGLGGVYGQQDNAYGELVKKKLRSVGSRQSMMSASPAAIRWC